MDWEKQEKMLKDIMVDWMGSTDQFIYFEKKHSSIVMCFGNYKSSGKIDNISMDWAVEYQTLFDDYFKEYIKEYLEEGNDYFNDEQYAFLKEYLKIGE